MSDPTKFGPGGEEPLTPVNLPYLGAPAASPFDAFVETPALIDDTPVPVEPVKGEKWTSRALIELLGARYPTDRGEYALYEQVGNATGHACNSWIDAIVMGLWPSSGLMRMAFEVKVSRGDFMREMENPGKNLFARQNCHEFWFVAPAGVIKEGEVPEADGWMAPRGDKLVVVKRPLRRNVNATQEFMAALGRAAFKSMDRQKKSMGEDYIRESKLFKEAEAWQMAAKAFMSERGVSVPWNAMYNEAAILATLKEATADKEIEKARKQILDIVGELQRRMVAVADITTALASASVLATDEAGQFIVKAYGDGNLGARLRKTQRRENREWETILEQLRKVITG